jgi:hypothetical protein
MQVLISGVKTKSRDLPDRVISGVHQKAYQPAGSNTVVQDNLIPDYTIGSSHESITYSTKRANQRAQSNLCLHTRNLFNYSDISSGWSCLATVPNPDWEWRFYQNHHRACCDLKDTIIALSKTALGGSFDRSYLGANGQAYINTVMDRLRPDLRTVSVPNFLADIEDLKDLFKLWKKHVSLAKNLAGAHLNFKFGWKPTVGDISDMIEGVTHMREKLAAFESQLGKIISDSTTLDASSSTVTGTYRVPGGALATYTATVNRKCIGALAWEPQPLAVMGGMDKILRGLLDSLGFELNPRIIWDAVPFTFVIDWFFGVGSWLDRFRVDTLELPIHLVDGYLQYKETLNVEWFTVSDHLTGYVPFPRSAAARFSGTFFHRMPIYPDYATLSGLGWRMPTLNQAALLVSLATVLKKS